MIKKKIYKEQSFKDKKIFSSDPKITRRFYFSGKDKLFKSFNPNNFTLSPRCYPLARICRASNSLFCEGGVL